MKTYELAYLALPTLTEQELLSLEEKISKIIEQEGCILIEKTNPIKKALGQKIKKNESAFFGKIILEGPGEKINSLISQLKETPQILRHLINKQKPKRIMKAARKPRGSLVKETIKPKKVEFKEIEKKLDEILENESK